MNTNVQEKTTANFGLGTSENHSSRRRLLGQRSGAKTRETRVDATSNAGIGGRRRLAMFGSAIAIVAGAVLATASGASAGTSPVTYSAAHDACTRIVNGSAVTDTMDVGRPVAVANYTGTTYLYWQGQIQVDDNGVWYDDASPVGGAYADIWAHSGTQLTPIYWGNSPNNYGIAVQVPNGYSWRIIGETYWWNGSSWFQENNTIAGGCNFS